MDIETCKKNCHKKFKFKVRKVVDEQIETFFEIEKSNFKLEKHNYKVGDDVILNKYHYLHGVSKNDEAINFVSEYGIISKDAVTGDKTKHAFSFVSGFWLVSDEIKLHDYIINYSGMDVRFEDTNLLVPYGKLDQFVEDMRNTDHWLWEGISSMEIRFMPSLARDINQYGFILNVSSDQAKKLIKNNVNDNGYNRNISKHFANIFKEKDEKKIKTWTFKNRASYVIFGLNRCFIEGVLVGRRVENDKTLLKELKEKFPNCYICNLDGKVIKE